MDELRFTWDEPKNRANRRKHGVSFEEAQSAFLDENARVYVDPDHSEHEAHSSSWDLVSNSEFWSCVIATARET
jgi:uncharacterized DUF497 family protein